MPNRIKFLDGSAFELARAANDRNPPGDYEYLLREFTVPDRDRVPHFAGTVEIAQSSCTRYSGMQCQVTTFLRPVAVLPVSKTGHILWIVDHVIRLPDTSLKNPRALYVGPDYEGASKQQGFVDAGPPFVEDIALQCADTRFLPDSRDATWTTQLARVASTRNADLGKDQDEIQVAENQEWKLRKGRLIGRSKGLFQRNSAAPLPLWQVGSNIITYIQSPGGHSCQLTIVVKSETPKAVKPVEPVYSYVWKNAAILRSDSERKITLSTPSAPDEANRTELKQSFLENGRPVSLTKQQLLEKILCGRCSYHLY